VYSSVLYWKSSPLYDTLFRYKNFFDLFENFEGYINFFFLDDLINKNKEVKFYLPFDNFNTRPVFSSVEDYLTYKDGVTNFIMSRNKRINNYVKQQLTK